MLSHREGVCIQFGQFWRRSTNTVQGDWREGLEVGDGRTVQGSWWGRGVLPRFDLVPVGAATALALIYISRISAHSGLLMHGRNN